MPSRKLVLVSNRLPFSLKRRDNGIWAKEDSHGGLVTALAPVIAREAGIWIGWHGSTQSGAPTAELSRRRYERGLSTGQPPWMWRIGETACMS
jgi:trehalose-6-phosphate synthase